MIVAKLFLAGADLNVTDKNGKTPLSYAIQSGNQRVVEDLKQKGAQLPSPDVVPLVLQTDRQENTDAISHLGVA